MVDDYHDRDDLNFDLKGRESPDLRITSLLATGSARVV